MAIPFKAALAGLLALAGAAGLTGCRATPAGQGVTISVAASLQKAMQDLAVLYAQTNSGVKLTFNYGSSGALEQQIEQGAPVDVFLPAAARPMDLLESKGLVAPGTRHDLLRNGIVLITAPGYRLPDGFSGLTSARVKVIALGNPDSVPAGDYGRQVLTALGVWEQVRSKVVLAKDVRQVLSYVETGNADAGIVYATDARQSGNVEVAATAAENTHVPVIYPVAVMKQSRNREAAREFVHFLTGTSARAVFARHGFTTIAP